MLDIDQEIGELIVTGATPFTIFNKAVENGMTPILESGLIKILQGITTPEEILRVAI